MIKSIRFVFILLALGSGSIEAQSTTLDIMGGYSLPIAPSSEAVERYEYHYNNFPYYATAFARVRRMSFGQGGNLAFNFNWFSKKNIGFGVKMNFLFGSGFYHSTTIIDGVNREYYKHADKSFSFQFIPHLCFRHDYKVVSPVLEAGMIIGMAQINQNSTITFSNYSNTVQSTIRDYGNVFLGFYSSLGLSFNISKAVKINLALNCTAGSYSPSKWKRTKYTVDGTDYLSALPIGAKEGNYVRSLDLTVLQSDDVPRKSLKYSAAFSSIGLSTGICIMIGKKQKRVHKKAEPELIRPF